MPKTPPISKPEIILIPFRGQEILSVKKENKTYIIPKQICQNLGIDWEAQRQKIQRDTVRRCLYHNGTFAMMRTRNNVLTFRIPKWLAFWY